MHRRRNQNAAFYVAIFLIPAILLLVLLLSAFLSNLAFAAEIRTYERFLLRAWVTHCRATQALPIIGEDPLVDIEIPDPKLGCSFTDSGIGDIEVEGEIIIRRDGQSGPILEMIFEAIVRDGRSVWGIADWCEVEDFTDKGARYECASRLAFLEDDRPLRYDVAFMRNASNLTWAESFETGEELIVENPDTTTMIRIERTKGNESVIFLLDYRECEDCTEEE